MIEVHVGTKPGRPTLMLIGTAALLAGTLGVAWIQVVRSRELGVEQPIPGTPLLVRPPKSWVAEPNQPGSFVLPVRRGPPGQESWEVDRRVRFGYEPWPVFEPPGQWLSARQVGSTPLEPARIGPYPAAQARQVLRRRWGREIITRESVLRTTSLPGGSVIFVEYVPMTDLTPADLKLFDQICAAVRLDDATLSPTPSQVLQRAGVDFPFQRGWTAGLPQLPDVAGLFVGGDEDGLPAWSLGVFRTWLATARAPRDLLLDFSASAWLLADEMPDVREWTRSDGVRIAEVHHPDSLRNWQPIAAAWLVVESPSKAALFILYTDEPHLARAQEAAQRIAEQIAIAPIDAIPALPPAEQAGATLAALIAQKGAVPWWGREPTEFRYAGKSPQGDEMVLASRAATRRDPERGYEGGTRRRVRNKNWEEVSSWTIDGRAVAYTYRMELYAGEGVAVSVRDRRSSEGDLVHRIIALNDVQRWAGTFRPGPAFVAPPVESIAEAWVARQASAPVLIEAATPLGHGTHSRLLRPLPPKEGNPRVLLQDDYRPLGSILAFDENGELRYQIEPGARYERLQ